MEGVQFQFVYFLYESDKRMSIILGIPLMYASEDNISPRSCVLRGSHQGTGGIFCFSNATGPLVSAG
jgi:hypothetical protein